MAVKKAAKKAVTRIAKPSAKSVKGQKNVSLAHQAYMSITGTKPGPFKGG
jgi:hypothetical protein